MAHRFMAYPRGADVSAWVLKVQRTLKVASSTIAVLPE